MRETAIRQGRRVADISLSLGLAAVIVFFVLGGGISYFNTRTLMRDSQLVVHTHDVIIALEDVQSIVKDAETGQRGYVLTGREDYLMPYSMATNRLEGRLGDLEMLLVNDSSQQHQLRTLKAHIRTKLDELAETIALRRGKSFQAALDVVLSDRGKGEMDQIRQTVNEIQQAERIKRAQRLSEMDEAYRTAMISGIITGLLGVLLSSAVTYLIRHAAFKRRQDAWLQGGEMGLATAMLGELRLEQLGSNVLGFLSKYLDAQAAVFYARDNGTYKRVATYGIPTDSTVPEAFGYNDGLLGKVAQDGMPFMLDNVPEGYITLGSALGQSTPRHLLIVAARIDEGVNAIMEFGFLHPVQPLTRELLDSISEPVGMTVRSAMYRAHLQNLLEETQRQTEELQAQSEELRVSNEELEEQSRALKESQSRLEQQQAELEQTNNQLSQQAEILAQQRDDLAETKNSVQLKARELERASQYKSDFLANMSHELRTPLNSLLILAKLLADNPAGNLSAEQVKYAQTIQSSGNDLLTLINDILDLSKIEAGYMELRAESVPFSRLRDDLNALFMPAMKQKNLAFTITVAPDCPKAVITDRQRVEQVLKNLLSNALKFTERGAIALTISRAQSGHIALAVTDTGIGIPAEQQQAIFDAFRQADGTISRKYGGTGLGLSISRELARLLGGHIALSSEQGKGSSFTLFIPEKYEGAALAADVPKPAMQHVPAMHETASVPKLKPAPHYDDDRDRLNKRDRVILVVEDDLPFARILYDLVHELKFDCLLAHTAEEALATAQRYLPSAIILDVGLPDHSGLSVLDRLKRDPRTRHIPVHVISAGDYAQTAMSLGAIGYMLKPVKREQLADALEQLENRLSDPVRRVLIIEDDAVQRESVSKLLGTVGVQTVAVGTAAECLDKLKEQTFDCMVLDLSLPDESGYSLLEKLSREESYAFPPVIVYTGRNLTADQEQQLRRYSKSIIIKGAKSPERLLDEVTLFLHQVVSELPPEQRRMLEQLRNRDEALEDRHILIVEDDVRNVYALSNILEPRGAIVHIARNGREALDLLEKTPQAIDLVLMDVMMPEMDGLTATRHIRKRAEWKKLPIIMLPAKAMRDDQERCLEAGANDYMAKPLDVEKLLSLIRVWMPR